MKHKTRFYDHSRIFPFLLVFGCSDLALQASVFGWVPPTPHEQQQAAAPQEFAWVPPTPVERKPAVTTAPGQFFGFEEERKVTRKLSPSAPVAYPFTVMQKQGVPDDPEAAAFFKELSGLEMDTFNLAPLVSAILKTYQPKQAATPALFGFATKGHQAVAVSAFGGSTTNIFDKKTFTKFKECLNGSGASYLSYLTGLWDLYGKQYEHLIKQGKEDEAKRIILNAFSSGSCAVAMYGQLVGQIITFIKTRLNSFSLFTFGQSGATYFLTTELPQLDTIVAQAQQQFDAHFAGGPDGFPAVGKLAGANATTLSQNYKIIERGYQEQKGTLCADFVMSLAKTLADTYQPMLAYEQSIKKVLDLPFGSVELTSALANLNTFYSLAENGLDLLNEKNPIPPFGVYKNPYQALQAMSGNLASFYFYASLVGQNVITAACKTPDSLAYQNQLVSSNGQLQSSFYQTMSSYLTCIQSYYQSASQYYAAQLNSTNSAIYNQVSAYFSAGSAYWTKAESLLANNDFPDAIAAYQSAAQAFKKAGNSDLSFVLTHRCDAAALAYYQTTLQSYTQFYQLAIPAYLAGMLTPPSSPVTSEQASTWHSAYPNGFVQLFYYDAATNQSGLTPSFQGIAWLATQAVPVYSHMLNAYQTDHSATGKSVRQYLQQSLVILENIAQGAQGMFYNDPLMQTKSLRSESALSQYRAADANSGSGTIQGVTEGALQYIKIYESFAKADTLLAQGATAGNQALQLPYQGLFSGQSVSGFAQLSCLVQLYWSLLNVDPCLARAQQYSDYAGILTSAALILLSQAQALCSDPTLASVLSSSYAASVQEKTKQIATPSSLSSLVAEGDALRKTATNAVAFESALACYRTAGLLGDITAQANYLETIEAYADWYRTSSNVDFAHFYAASVYYRGYLAQKKGWQSTSNALAAMTKELQTFSSDFGTALDQLGLSVQNATYPDAIKRLGPLVALQDEMNFMVVRQKREQAFFGVSEDFLTLTKTVIHAGGNFSQIPTSSPVSSQTKIRVQFPLASTVTCPAFVSTLSNLAQLYLTQGAVLLASLKKDFEAGKYASSPQEAYEAITNNFSQAATFFGKSGEEAMVLTVQQAITQAAAFAYYSSVIPAPKTTQLLQETVAQKASLSAEFVADQIRKSGATKASPRTTVFAFQEPASPSKKQPALERSTFFGFSAPRKGSSVPAQQVQENQGAPAVTIPTGPVTVGTLFSVDDPDYLLRYSEQDLTLAAQEEKASAALAKISQTTQRQAKAMIAKVPGAHVPVTSSVPVPTYQGLLTVAQTALGTQTKMQTTTTDMALIKDLVSPLYRLLLVENGYTSQLCPLDQEVQRYTAQVTKLVSQGMSFGSFSLFTSYVLEKRKMADGTEHVILITINGPLQAVPRFQGEFQTAIAYYTQYGEFYALSQQTVQVGGTLFYQLPDPNFLHQAKAFKGVIGAYLSQIIDYQAVIKNIMKSAPVITTLADRKKYVFENYSSVYGLLNTAYTWLLSALGGIQNLQQTQGIFWISSGSFNELNFQNLCTYMKDSSRFLVGYPTSAPYKKVLEDIGVLGTMAMNYTNNQALLLSLLGDLYEDAGDLTLLYEQSAPTINGYPSTASTNLPLGAQNLTSEYPGCFVPVAGTAQVPKNFGVTWESYNGSSKFYLVAFQKFQDAYLASTGEGNIMATDTDFRRAWGNYVLVLLRAMIQRIALFGRNSTSATFKTVGVNTQISLGTNAYFGQVVTQGQTYGGAAALQGFSALQGGALVGNDSATLQNQYSLMRGLLLDSFIFCSAVEKATQSLYSDPTGNLSKQSVLGLAQLLKCAIAYYMPGMQVLAAREEKVGSAYEAGTVGENQTEKVELATPVLVLPLSEVGLDKLGEPNFAQLTYSNVFQPFMEYCLYGLMGSEDDPRGPFPNLINPENIAALNNFASQLYSAVQSLYAHAFLPTSVQNNPVELANDLKAAIQAREQNMIVNPEAYVG